jgi:hypothetical protein
MVLSGDGTTTKPLNLQYNPDRFDVVLGLTFVFVGQ